MIKVSDLAKDKAIQLMTEEGFKPFEDYPGWCKKWRLLRSGIRLKVRQRKNRSRSGF